MIRCSSGSPEWTSVTCGVPGMTGHAAPSGAGGTAAAVQVVLVVGGRVDVDDQIEAVDMDAAGGDVGGDEHGDVPGP
ncbi:hypothetical protein STANM309S_01803 [Streptomyces tanashiensis]